MSFLITLVICVTIYEIVDRALAHREALARIKSGVAPCPCAESP